MGINYETVCHLSSYTQMGNNTNNLIINWTVVFNPPWCQRESEGSLLTSICHFKARAGTERVKSGLRSWAAPQRPSIAASPDGYCYAELKAHLHLPPTFKPPVESMFMKSDLPTVVAIRHYLSIDSVVHGPASCPERICSGTAPYPCKKLYSRML